MIIIKFSQDETFNDSGYRYVEINNVDSPLITPEMVPFLTNITGVKIRFYNPPITYSTNNLINFAVFDSGNNPMIGVDINGVRQPVVANSIDIPILEVEAIELSCTINTRPF
jgi:hypothetical protein